MHHGCLPYEVLNDSIYRDNFLNVGREARTSIRIAMLVETAPQVRDTFEYFFDLHHTCPLAYLERRPAPLPEERYHETMLDQRYANVWWEPFKGELAPQVWWPSYGCKRRLVHHRRLSMLGERGRGRPREGKAISRWRGTEFMALAQWGERKSYMRRLV